MDLTRSSGILMPISSLPSPYGIGSLGRAAYDFIDFLAEARQSWWQILPVGPTSYGDSPYQSFSTFAGNPYFIDLDTLVEDGLLRREEFNGIDWGEDERYVDYEKIYLSRFAVLRIAADRGISRDRAAFDAFVNKHRSWLPGYALFMSLKKKFGMRSWLTWEDEDIRLHRPEAVARYTAELADDIEFYEYLQFLFYGQWEALHAYAKDKGVGIIGDLPIYVAMDSADIWSEPQFFRLDEKHYPIAVAGCPPDYFCEDGQLWGNPLYDWDAMRADGYGWWIRRIEGNAAFYDVLRIDHFRGFESYWSVPYGDETARNGEWLKGPGMDLVGRLTAWFYKVRFIAEDLGLLTPEVHKLLRDSGLPGMKVLEFAFDTGEPSSYLPHNHSENCICYIGTHDNAPVNEWINEAEPDELRFAEKYLGVESEKDLCRALYRAGMGSVAVLFVAQIQDALGLGAESRMNTPGTVGGNWRWRLTNGALTPELAEYIAEMTVMYGRAKPIAKKKEE